MLFKKLVRIIFPALILSASLFSLAPANSRSNNLPVHELSYQNEMNLNLYAGAKALIRVYNIPGNIEVLQISKVGLESSAKTRLLGKRNKSVRGSESGAAVDFAVEIADDSKGEVFKIKSFSAAEEAYDIEENVKIIVNTFQCAEKKPVCGLIEYDCDSWKGASCPQPRYQTFESMCDLGKHQATFAFEGSCD